MAIWFVGGVKRSPGECVRGMILKEREGKGGRVVGVSRGRGKGGRKEKNRGGKMERERQ